MDELDAFADRFEAMEAEMGGAGGVARVFGAEIEGLRAAMARTGADAARLERGLDGGLRRAIDGVAFDGMRLSDALATVARSLAGAAYGAAVSPVTGAVSGALTRGVGAFVAGGAAARLAVPASPASAPEGSGFAAAAASVAGAPAAAAPRVTINVATPDVAGFRRSRGQIAAELSRALDRGARNR